MSWKNGKFLIAFIILLATILRFWQLGLIPVGVTHDEMGYIYNAYSIAKTGKNIFGETLPFLTWINKGGWPFLPVPIYFSAPFFWFFDLSATVGRAPAALLGTLDVLLIYILVRQIFHKNSLALISGLFFAISPWHLHFSRSAYDPNFALFFYLAAIVVFIYEIKKGKIPIFSSLSFLLAIFSYRGMNIIFLPVAGFLIWYGIAVLKMTRRQFVAFFIGIVFIGLSLLSVIGVYGKAYTAEALFFQDPKIKEDIDIQIREAQGPLFIRRLFLNKATHIAYRLRENYLKGYSPEFLFLYTEPSKIYSIWSRGRIYFLDLILIVLGIAYLYKLNKKGASFIMALFLIGGLPGMFSGMPYSARNFFLAAIFPILSAGGVFFLLENALFKKLKYAFIALLIISYSYLLGSYLFDYYGRFALYGSEAWVKSIKDFSTIIISEKQAYQKVIVGTTSFGDFVQYAFYTKVNPSRVQNAWQQRGTTIDGPSFVLDNVVFIPGCISDRDKPPVYEGGKPVLYIAHDNCHTLATPSGVIRDYPKNIIWKLYKIQ